MRRLLVVLLVLALPASAAAGDRELLLAKEAYLAAAQRSYGNDPDGWQARYDAGRDLVEAVRAAGRPSAGCARLRDQLRGSRPQELGVAGRRSSGEDEGEKEQPAHRQVVPSSPWSR